MEVPKIISMKDKICPICKYYGRITWGDQSDSLFNERNEVKIHLCYSHSVDLFKKGQANFILKYREVFKGYDLLSDDSFAKAKTSSIFG